MPESFDKAYIARRLGESEFANNVIIVASLPSTNALARELGSKGALSGTLVLAEEQTAGRGRLGRRWLSPAKSNLLFSLLLRPGLRPEQAFVLTMTLAVAGAEAIGRSTGVSCLIKWPNDLFVRDRKLAGILTELSVRAGKMEYAVVGLGLNVHWHPEDQPECPGRTTSILKETGRPVSRNELLIQILSRFEDYYRELLSGTVDPLYHNWNRLSLLTGREVELDAGDEETIRGNVLRIDRDGALVIEDRQGEERRIRSGDVTVSRIE
jgi:BirA family biotin operon repressor/biotin-[acetyl-CoA-carboxylase] ligase